MASKRDATVPRLSASLIVVNQQNEILFVQRNPTSTAFAGMHVFPGGNFDVRQDEDDLRMTALRETFEETGVLLASPSAADGKRPSDADLDEAREQIHAQKELFRGFLLRWGLTPELDSLVRFTRWTTPPNQPRRFTTQFFLAFLPDAPRSSSASHFTSGDKHDRLPTPDGGQEVVAARFVHPTDALRDCAARQTSLMPPQFYLVSTLAPLLEGRKSTPEQRTRVYEMAKGAFGQMEVNPLPRKVAGVPEGWTCLTYEGDEERGGPRGIMHRSVVRFERPGVISDIQLLRNFDVYDDSVLRQLVQRGARPKM